MNLTKPSKQLLFRLLHVQITHMVARFEIGENEAVILCDRCDEYCDNFTITSVSSFLMLQYYSLQFHVVWQLSTHRTNSVVHQRPPGSQACHRTCVTTVNSPHKLGSSSAPSGQSGLPSHTNLFMMQCPVLHMKDDSLQRCITSPANIKRPINVKKISCS